MSSLKHLKTPGSEDNFDMENYYVSSSDDVFKYDTCDESCDGSKELTPASSDIYKHVTDSEPSERFYIVTNYKDYIVKCDAILNVIDKQVLLLQIFKGVLDIQFLYQRTVDINFDIMIFVTSEMTKKWRQSIF